MRSGPMHGGGRHGGPGPGHGMGMGMGPQGGHTMGGMPHGAVQQDTRAYVMWNDGHGWRRMELAPGGVPGGMPRRGPPQGPMQGQPQGGRSFVERFGAAPAEGVPATEQLRKALEMLEALRAGAEKPGAAGQPGQAGAAVDPAQLKALLEMLEQLTPRGGYRIEAGPGDAAAHWLQLWRKAAPGKPAEQPKRVKIKPSSPKKLEVIEEVEELEEIEIK